MVSSRGGQWIHLINTRESVCAYHDRRGTAHCNDNIPSATGVCEVPELIVVIEEGLDLFGQLDSTECDGDDAVPVCLDANQEESVATHPGVEIRNRNLERGR